MDKILKRYGRNGWFKYNEGNEDVDSIDVCSDDGLNKVTIYFNDKHIVIEGFNTIDYDNTYTYEILNIIIKRVRDYVNLGSLSL